MKAFCKQQISFFRRLNRFYVPCLLLFMCAINMNTLAVDVPTMPLVSNFSKNDYHGSNSNWTIAQDNQGIMYFANDEGLLSYDGSRWQMHFLPNHIGLRAVAIGNDKRIYTGSYEEFGYWEADACGLLNYHSLKNLVKDFQFNNDEIWRIVINGNKVYFQSFGAYFVYDGKSVVAHHFGAVLFFLKADNTIYTQKINEGLFYMQADEMVFLQGSEQFKNDLVRAILPFDAQHILICTASRGLFLFNKVEKRFSKWNTTADNLLIAGQINSASLLADSSICLGTIGNGIVCIDRHGVLKWHLNKDNALRNNTVLFLYTDWQNNVWAALDKGIAIVHLNSPFSYLLSQTTNIGSAYTAIQFQNKIYIGTNQGLYKLNLSKTQASFSMLPNTHEQVWQLSSVDNQLFCGHNRGTFKIEDDKATNLSTLTGGASIKPITIGNDNYLIQCSYTSLAVYKKDQKGNWFFSHAVSGFSSPVRLLEVDHLGYIWVSHIVKGLYRIKLNADLTKAIEVKLYGQADGLPSDFNVGVFKLAGRVVFCSGKQIYIYDDLKDKIVPFEWLNSKIGEFASAHLIIPIRDAYYWLVKKGKFALLEMDKNEVKLLDQLFFSSFDNKLIDGHEYITAIDSNKFLICLDNGLALYDRSLKKNVGAYKAQVLLRSVQAFSSNKSILLPLETAKNKSAKIAYSFRQIVFSFAYPEFSNKKLSYVCSLNGKRFEPADTVLAFSTQKTYTNLASGNYTLIVKVLDESGVELSSSTYYFEIIPPFYASLWAFSVYFIAIVLAFFVFLRWLKLHIQQQKEQALKEQAKQQQIELEKGQQKIIRLKNEKLEDELKHKSKELASSTMAMIRKNDMLIALKEEIESQKQKLGTQYPNKYYEKLISLIDQNITSDDDWQIFQENFDMIHESFFRNLKKRYPELTSHDLKLCAYLRLNLTTKEIASLLNISPRGVEAARYRLRKKLQLSAEQNLIEFFIEFV